MSLQRMLFLCFSLFLLSCEKDKDEQPPQITWTSPAENSTFTVLENIPVRAQIQDNEKIREIRLGLYASQSNQLIMPPVVIQAGASNYDLNIPFLISDSLLESGLYYLKLSASDEESETTSFRNLSIGELKKERLEIVYALNETSGSCKIMGLNNNQQARMLVEFNSMGQDIQVNSQDQMLWFISNTNRLAAYQIKENRIAFDQNLPNSGINPFFNQLSISDRKAYLSTAGGDMRAYTSNFNEVFTYQSSPGRSVSQFHVGSNYLMIEEPQIANNQNDISSLFTLSGAKEATSVSSRKTLGFGFINDDQVQWASQSGSVFFLSELDPRTGLSNDLISRTAVPFEHGIFIGADEWLFYGASGAYYYKRSTQFLKELDARAIADASYDALNQEAILALGQSIVRYQIPSGNLLGSYSAGANIKSLALRYNR